MDGVGCIPGTGHAPANTLPKHYTDRYGSVTENDILAFIDRIPSFYVFVIWNNLKSGCQRRRKRRISICSPIYDISIIHSSLLILHPPFFTLQPYSRGWSLASKKPFLFIIVFLCTTIIGILNILSDQLISKFPSDEP